MLFLCVLCVVLCCVVSLCCVVLCLKVCKCKCVKCKRKCISGHYVREDRGRQCKELQTYLEMHWKGGLRLIEGGREQRRIDAKTQRRAGTLSKRVSSGVPSTQHVGQPFTIYQRTGGG